MYKFIERNRKKFLAVFAVELMIVFVLPQVALDRSRGTSLEVVAHVGDGGEPIQVGEVREAKDHWREINTYLGMHVGAVALVQNDIENDPQLFVLLQREAEQMGLRVPQEQAVEAVTMIARQYEMFGQRLPNPSALVPAMQRLLLVRSLFERVAEGIKLSDPVVMHEVAANAQRVKLNVVHTSAADFEKDVPAPTPEAIQKHFDAFKNQPAGAVSDRNPFGFGYQIPSRVQLLYLTIPRDEVARVVRASKTEFQWKVDATLRYRTTPAKYQTTATQPATDESTSQPATTQDASATKPTSGPTTKPFAEVHEQIVKELMDPLVDRRVDEIGATITGRMNADYEAFQKRSTGAAADFGTRQYLERVAADIEKRDGVKLGVSEINDPKDEKSLAELKGIGQSVIDDTPFARYVMQSAENLLPAGARTGNDVLSLDEPSRRLKDPSGNVYIAQIQDAQLAHAPADLNAVKDKVTADVRTQAAFEAAVAATKTLFGQVSAGGLEAAAKAAGKDVFTMSDFMDRQGNAEGVPASIIPRIELSPASRQKLVTQAFEMLAQATQAKPHPTRIVELQDAGRVAIIELADVERPWPDDQEDFLKYSVSQRLMMQRAQRILADYFRPDAVKRRLEYKARNETQTETAAAN